MRHIAVAVVALALVVTYRDELVAWGREQVAVVRQQLATAAEAAGERRDSGGRGGGGCATGVDGFDDEQLGNAAIIAEVGRDMDMPDRAIVVALATAMQESGLRNLDYGDRDSLGLFQQRPSQGWGSESQVQDPEHASRSFYRSLRKVDGWQEMRVTEAAQRVQISAFPEAYQKWADDAERLAGALERC